MFDYSHILFFTSGFLFGVAFCYAKKYYHIIFDEMDIKKIDKYSDL